MRNPKGYNVWTDRENGKTFREVDSAQCMHCGGHILVKPGTACTIYLVSVPPPENFKEEAGAFCRNCMGPICLLCHEDGRCVHFMRKIEQAEARQRLRDACQR